MGCLILVDFLLSKGLRSSQSSTKVERDILKFSFQSLATVTLPIILSHQALVRPGVTQNCLGLRSCQEKTVYTTKLSGFKSLRIQSSHFKFRIQNLRRHEQTGEFPIRIRPLVCKRQNQSGTKPSRIRHESGKISSSVNVVLVFCFHSSKAFYSIQNTSQNLQQ